MRLSQRNKTVASRISRTVLRVPELSCESRTSECGISLSGSQFPSPARNWVSVLRVCARGQFASARQEQTRGDLDASVPWYVPTNGQMLTNESGGEGS